MPFKKILEKIKGKKEEEEKEEIEITEEAFKEEIKPKIKIDKLESYTDTTRIQESLRNGIIVLLSIQELRKRNINDLKKSVEKLKATIKALNGDIVGIDDNYLLLTPGYARIYRG
ncbi:MAG: cell division protein SepF [Candidatus Aenigmatarchaeota archaeon]|jgi:SepF-like predicted cell division protein (DUF552 family)